MSTVSTAVTRPGGNSEKTTTRESLIDRHAHFDGVYSTTHDLRIEGNAEGEIRCEGTVTIAEDAYVNATVYARDVIVAGSANGEIVCLEHFTLQPTGEMNGGVRAASLVVEEGAVFEGEFHMADEPDGTTEFDQWADESLFATDIKNTADTDSLPSFGKTDGFGDELEGADTDT